MRAPCIAFHDMCGRASSHAHDVRSSASSIRGLGPLAVAMVAEGTGGDRVHSLLLALACSHPAHRRRCVVAGAELERPRARGARGGRGRRACNTFRLCSLRVAFWRWDRRPCRMQWCFCVLAAARPRLLVPGLCLCRVHTIVRVSGLCLCLV